MHVYQNKKVFALVVNFSIHREFRNYNILEVEVESVGTKYFYIKHDYQLKVGKGRDRYRKTTGGCVESNPSRFVKIFNTKKEAEKFVVEHHKTRWKGMIKRILERDELTLDQYTKIGEILGMKEFSPF